MYFCNKNKIDIFFCFFYNESILYKKKKKNLKPNFWLVIKYLMLIIAYPTQYDLSLQESYQTKNGLSLWRSLDRLQKNIYAAFWAMNYFQTTSFPTTKRLKPSHYSAANYGKRLAELYLECFLRFAFAISEKTGDA